jgi:predicted NAD/FAD-binding protein
MPKLKRAWASWNYHVPADPSQNVRVTYDVNRLQSLGAPSPICVTLNDPGDIDANLILAKMTYHHPVYSQGAIAAQRRHAEISGTARTHFCGAYWGYGFHEDGVNSALAVTKFFGKDIDSCIVASTTAKSSIGERHR